MKARTNKGYEKLRVIYEKNLSVDLLAEDLYQCNLHDSSLIIKQEMTEKDFDIFGVEDHGKVIGYVLREKLTDGKIEDNYQPFHSGDLVSDSTSLIELLEILRNKNYLFILEKNRVTKIVTFADLQKQPIRMLAFSLISLLEMLLISLIKEAYPDESWKEKLSEERLQKAEEMLKFRIEKNEALTLVDNTQLADKGTIVVKTDKLRKQLGFESKTRCKEFFKNIETLRNNTAHAQEEIYHNSEELIDVILELDRVLDSNARSESNVTSH
ncbi:MAG: hypothetical protein ACQEXB_25840 [Bacillota bacterium]